MTRSGAMYDFAFRGLLAEEALDKAGRPLKNTTGYFDAEVASELSISLLDEDLVNSAKRMAAVYTAIAAFENSARQLVSSVLREALGEQWWEKGVSEQIRRKADARRMDEEKTRWHAVRGTNPINYSELGDLANIIRNNQETFQPYIPDVEWARGIFMAVEKSRNVIMHSGELHIEDVRRVGINIRDWVRQVGA